MIVPSLALLVGVQRRKRFLTPFCRPGWSLLELVATMVILAVLLALTFGTVAATMQTEQASLKSFNKLARQGALADQFRTDVAQAKSAPAAFEKLVKGPACLLLEMPDGSYIAYRFEKGHLKRVAYIGKQTDQQDIPLGEKGGTVEFTWAGKPAGKLVTLRVKTKSGPPLDIAAAVGGDNQ
jgi:prepilin-type N-terminal cleavage/methylation domain-containing protein